MRIKIREVTYESVPDAAKALGVSKSYIYTALHRGRIDTVGLGSNSPLYRGRNRGRKNFVSFFGGKLTFPTVTEAAKALGYTQQGLNKIYLGKTGKRSKETLQLRAMHYLTEQNRQKASKFP